MTPEERNEKFDRQTEEQYSALGRCVVHFELLVNAMRVGIVTILEQNGLRNQQLTNILLANITAAPLKQVLQAIVGQVVRLNSTERGICDRIFERVEALTKRRNEIVHGTWFIGWVGVEDVDFSVARGHKLTRGKTGASVKSLDCSASDLRRFAAECDATTQLVFRLCGCVATSRPIERNFVVEGGRVSARTDN
jgi:hypothetical protein